MAGAPPRYSEKQWAALFARVFDDKVSIAQAHREANEGKLPGIEAFPVSYDQCRERCRLEEVERAARAPLTRDELSRLEREIWTEWRKDWDRYKDDHKRALRARKRDGERESGLRTTAMGLTKQFKEIRTMRLPESNGNGDNGKPEPERPATFMEAIADEMANGGAAPEPTEHQDGERDETEPPSEKAGEDEEEQSGAVASNGRAVPRALAHTIRPDLHAQPVDDSARAQ